MMTNRLQPLPDDQAAAYNSNGYEIMRERDQYLLSAVRSHCVWKRVPFLVVRIRRRYCSVWLDLDTLARPIPTDRFPFTKWADEAVQDIRPDLRSQDDRVENDLIYLQKVRIGSGIRLAMRIAEYLKEQGYGASTGKTNVIDLATERRSRTRNGPDGIA